jgi:hypothetical protein
VATFLPQAIQFPDDKKYPDKQAVAAVLEVQALAPLAQATHDPVDT